jgi:hypothetical protein
VFFSRSFALFDASPWTFLPHLNASSFCCLNLNLLTFSLSTSFFLSTSLLASTYICSDPKQSLAQHSITQHSITQHSITQKVTPSVAQSSHAFTLPLTHLLETLNSSKTTTPTPISNMQYPTKPLQGNFIGEGIFENDAAIHAVAYLNELVGLDKLTPTTSADGNKVVYSIFADGCSSSEACELVRSHLDSGVLHKITARMVSNYTNPLSMKDYTCGGFVPIILGACAMSLGCRTLYTAPGYEVFFKTYKAMLIGALPSAPLMDAAKEQMKKALLGPDGFEPGTPIDFKRYARPIDYSPRSTEDAGFATMLGGNPVGYKPPSFKAGSSYGNKVVVLGPCMREHMGYPIDPKKCPCCSAKRVSLVCAKCKVQVYCSKACQVGDHHRHKVCCRKPEDAESMKDEGLWNNMFSVDDQSYEDDVASISKNAKDPMEAFLDLFVTKLAGGEHARHFGVMVNGLKLPK